MTREEFCTPETIFMISHVYEVYKKMKEKYQYSVNSEEGHHFSFFNYRNTGIDVVMNRTGFYLYDGDSTIFEIFTEEPPLWVGFDLKDNEFTWYNDYSDFTIYVSDHNAPKSYFVLDRDDDSSVILEEYDEGYFFQQMTVQNIIPFEQFEKEVNWFYNYVNPVKIEKNDMIIVTDFDAFDLRALEGFRVI